jgi:hypothetical protein
MAPFWIDDLDVFFRDFATEALWKGVEVKVIFHNEYEAVTLFAGQIESSHPYVEVKSSDIESAAHGDVLEIDGTQYYVSAIKPDGTGITVLELSLD